MYMFTYSIINAFLHFTTHSFQWGEKCKKKESKLFESREDAVAYCQQLLDKKELFHRARKIVQNKKGRLLLICLSASVNSFRNELFCGL